MRKEKIRGGFFLYFTLPHVIFFSILLVHVFVGIPNYEFYSVDLTGVSKSVSLVACIFYLLGVLFCKVFVSPMVKISDFYIHSAGITVAKWGVCFSLVACFFYVVMNGVLIGGGFWDRFSRNGLLILFCHLGIVSFVYICAYSFFSKERLKPWAVIALLVYTLFLLALGYRTPLVVLYLSIFFCYAYAKIKRRESLSVKKIVASILMGFAVVYFLSLVAIYRVSSDYDYLDYFYHIDWGEVDEIVYPIMPVASTVRADYWHLEKADYKLSHSSIATGSLFLSDILSPLPGYSLNSRNMVGSLVDARIQPDGKPLSITASLHGIIYLDFGIFGVGGGFFFIGFMLRFFSFLIFRKSFAYVPVISFWLANTIKSVHSGYFDFSFYILLLFSFLVLFLMKRKVVLFSGGVSEKNVW